MNFVFTIYYDTASEDVALICPQRGLVNFELNLSFTGVVKYWSTGVVE